ncbi:MAG: hypothetical protein A2551_02990 [Elusimicrobia bacterium RIFOXYD2_FULL_34_30]|nr:MAG: hypothetical protein A2551_02990 [Elusimicrobia bacterium RIFOXYD2_FULL_34_30]
MKKFKIGLALGGGGARGLAHIGVLRTLEKNGIFPDYIAGTSMGAILGAMYCCGMTTNEIEHKIKIFLTTEIYKKMRFESMLNSEIKTVLDDLIGKIKKKTLVFLSGVKMAFIEKIVMDEMIAFFLPDIDFQDLKIPFACVAIDICHGREVILKEGPIQEAVISSMSIPGIMPPVKFNDNILVDGGAVRVIPIKVVRDMGSDFLIGVDVSSKLRLISEEDINSAFEISQRTSEIAFSTLRQMQLKEADFLISPPVKEIKWFELVKFNECILAGENETIKKLPELKSKINLIKCKTFFGRILG